MQSDDMERAWTEEVENVGSKPSVGFLEPFLLVNYLLSLYLQLWLYKCIKCIYFKRL